MDANAVFGTVAVVLGLMILVVGVWGLLARLLARLFPELTPQPRPAQQQLEQHRQREESQEHGGEDALELERELDRLTHRPTTEPDAPLPPPLPPPPATMHRGTFELPSFVLPPPIEQLQPPSVRRPTPVQRPPRRPIGFALPVGLLLALLWPLADAGAVPAPNHGQEDPTLRAYHAACTPIEEVINDPLRNKTCQAATIRRACELAKRGTSPRSDAERKLDTMACAVAGLMEQALAMNGPWPEAELVAYGRQVEKFSEEYMATLAARRPVSASPASEVRVFWFQWLQLVMSGLSVIAMLVAVGLLRRRRS